MNLPALHKVSERSYLRGTPKTTYRGPAARTIALGQCYSVTMLAPELLATRLLRYGWQQASAMSGTSEARYTHIDSHWLRYG